MEPRTPLAAALLFAVLGPLSVRHLGGRDVAAPCADPVAVRDGAGARRDACGLDTLTPVLRLCPPTRPVQPGDVLTLAPRGLAGCATAVEPLPAAARLRLGLRLDANREPADALAEIPGIGPALAARIEAGRPYATSAELERIRGIGPARARTLARYLTTAPPPRPPPWPPPDGSAPRTP